MFKMHYAVDNGQVYTMHRNVRFGSLSDERLNVTHVWYQAGSRLGARAFMGFDPSIRMRIFGLLMRTGCELGLKFGDGFWAAPRFAAFAAPSWKEDA
jgi:hypothetical protein